MPSGHNLALPAPHGLIWVRRSSGRCTVKRGSASWCAVVLGTAESHGYEKLPEANQFDVHAVGPGGIPLKRWHDARRGEGEVAPAQPTNVEPGVLPVSKHRRAL